MVVVYCNIANSNDVDIYISFLKKQYITNKLRVIDDSSYSKVR